MKYVIDGTKIHNDEEFHAWIKNTFNLPYYGGNLSALWDAVTGMIEGPVEIVWRNSEVSKTKLENYDKIVYFLNKASAEYIARGKKDWLTIKYE